MTSRTQSTKSTRRAIGREWWLSLYAGMAVLTLLFQIWVRSYPMCRNPRLWTKFRKGNRLVHNLAGFLARVPCRIMNLEAAATIQENLQSTGVAKRA